MDTENSFSVGSDVSGSLTQTEENNSSESNTRESISSDEQEQREIYELEKLGKFKFQGKDLTVDDLKKGFAFQQDYTKKSQKLAEERKAFEAQQAELVEDQKFSSNYRADLKWVLENPAEIQKRAMLYMRTYPDKYHPFLQEVLSEQKQANANEQRPSYEHLQQTARLDKLEKFYNEQEVAKATSQLNQQIDSLKVKYPKAIPELVIGRVFEAFNQMLDKDKSAKLDSAIWERTFKQVQEERKKWSAEDYGELVKQQSTANAKSKDVASGGGSVGRAPAKFKNLGEVTKYAAAQLSGRR